MVKQCAICKEKLDPEHPLSVRQHNPLTFRIAWMHLWCLRSAFEDISIQPASSDEYDDRLDEYNMKFD